MNEEDHMVKSELIALVASKMPHLSERRVSQIVDYILETMREALVKGRRIEIRGFGSFSVRHHPPREAHNPKTGKKLVTEHKRSAHFKVGKALKERLNQNES